MTILLLRIINLLSDCMLADMRRFALDLIFLAFSQGGSDYSVSRTGGYDYF